MTKGRKRSCMLLPGLLLAAALFSNINAQEIIPEERRIEWSPGVPGGIPEITGPVFNVMDYGADSLGVGDSYNAVVSAMAAVPSSGGVVYFPEGEYRLSNKVAIGRDNIVFRGEGRYTRIYSEVSGNCFEIVTYQRGSWQTLAADAEKGSLMLTVPDGSKFTVGEFAEIEQSNDPALMYTKDDWIQSWAEQSVGQLLEVAAVNGNEVSFALPLNYTFTTALECRIRPQNFVKYVGFEDFYLEKMVASSANFYFKNAAYCWVKSVESYHTRTTHVDQHSCIGLEVRDSYFHRSFSYGGGGSGYGVGCGFHTTNTLVENNVFDSLRHAMIIQLGANGNVYGYNYSTNPVQGDGESNLNIGWDPPDISNHGHYAYMNLFEANDVVEVGIGDYWGPAGPGNTYFRNRVRGPGIYYYDASYGQNTVGNVTTKFTDNSGLDLDKLEHGNVEGGTTRWDPDITSQDLPDSYYLDEKPDFFGDMSWPAFGPDADPSNILPAQYRIEHEPFFTVLPDASSVGQYNKLEFSIANEKSYTNPFDPGEVDVYGIFLSPEGENMRINGFWDGTGWKLRFAGAETGSWNYTIYLADSSRVDQASGSFEVIASDELGWIRQSASAPHYLELDGGEPYFGIGMAVPWLVYDERYYEQPGLLDRISGYGVNMINWLFTSWDIQLLRDSYSSYSMDDAAAFDLLLEDAEEQGIKLMLGVWIHDMLRDAPHPWSGFYDWSSNPFNQLTGVDEFFSDPTSWAWQEKYYRYLIARYGHSQSIGMWHMVAEIDGTNAIYDDYAMKNDERGWHHKINAFFRQNDPYAHPTTVSGSGGYDFDEGWQLTDLPQVHEYPWPTDALVENTEKIATWAGTLFSRYEKPALIGEFGKSVYEEGKSETFLHNGIWAGLMNGAAATPLHWWGGQIAEQPDNFSTFNQTMLNQLQHMDQFLLNTDLREHHFQPRFPGEEGSLPYLEGMDLGRAYMLEGDSMSLAWVHQLAEISGQEFSGVKLLVPGMSDGWYLVDFYNTWNGTWISDSTYASCEAGLLEISLPGFNGDVAMKIWFKGNEGPVGLKQHPAAAAAYQAFQVYPNPMADFLVVERRDPGESVEAIHVLNASGQVLFQQEYSSTPTPGNSVRMDLPELRAGLYFIRITASDGSLESYKLVKTEG